MSIGGAAGSDGWRRPWSWVRRHPHPIVGLLGPMILMIANFWSMRRYTVDDAYISYRYARNLARGWGLVFNQGEPIEGYTNFLWTCVLAGGIRVGIDPVWFAKFLGCTTACASLVVCYALARRFRPFKTMPCVATWLLASSVPTVGYAMFGLETAAFVFLVLLGLWFMFREEHEKPGFWKSALVFGLAGLMRPEAPMFLGVAMLTLGRRFFSRQNLARGALFVAIVGAHLLWRKWYYDAWLPNTFMAKTGDIDQQLRGGIGYVRRYVAHAGPAVFLALYGFAIGVVRRNREIMTLAALTVVTVIYIMLVGGDWMPYFRHMSMVEPFIFVLVGLGVRKLVDTRDQAALIGIGLFAVVVGHGRYETFEKGRKYIRKDGRGWHSSAGGSAKWLIERGRPGTVAIADMGYVAYATDYPILDLLGLVDPVISKLPGGYTKKTGKAFVRRVFDVMPMYFVLIGKGPRCKKMAFPGQRKLHRHRKFRRNYRLATNIPLYPGGFWCIFERKLPRQ